MLNLNPKIRSGATIEGYRNEISVLSKYWRTEYPQREARELRVADLGVDLISGAAAWQVRRGRSAATANKLIRHATAIWRFALDDQGLAIADRPGPLAKIRKHREAKRLPEAWSISEFESILAAASRLRGKVGDVPASLFWLTLLNVAYWTGVRISALMAVRVCDVDLSAGTVKFTAETQKQFADQRFDLPPNVVDLIRQLDPHGRKLETLFGDWPFDRKQRQWRRLGYHLSRLLRSANLSADRLSKFHKIRRTFGTHVAAAAGAATAQSLLGHSNASTTKRYLDPRYMTRPNVTAILPAVASFSPQTLKVIG